MAVQRFRATGVSADNADAVISALRALPGVFFASVSHRDGSAEVDFEDDLVTVADMARAVQPLGVDIHIAG